MSFFKISPPNFLRHCGSSVRNRFQFSELILKKIQFNLLKNGLKVAWKRTTNLHWWKSLVLNKSSMAWRAVRILFMAFSKVSTRVKCVYKQQEMKASLVHFHLVESFGFSVFQWQAISHGMASLRFFSQTIDIAITHNNWDTLHDGLIIFGHKLFHLAIRT